MRTTLDRLFIAHPRAVNEDYLAHAGVAGAQGVGVVDRLRTGRQSSEGGKGDSALQGIHHDGCSSTVCAARLARDADVHGNAVV